MSLDRLQKLDNILTGKELTLDRTYSDDLFGRSLKNSLPAVLAIRLMDHLEEA